MEFAARIERGKKDIADGNIRVREVGLNRFQRMVSSGIEEVADLKCYSAPTVKPQAMAWDGKQLWMSSRDLGTLYRTESDGLMIAEPSRSERDGGVCRS